MAFCSNCGTKISDTEQFCGECGYPTSKTAAPAVPAQPRPAVQPQQQAFAPAPQPAPQPIYQQPAPQPIQQQYAPQPIYQQPLQQQQPSYQPQAPAKKKSKKPLIIGGASGVVAIILVVVLIFNNFFGLFDNFGGKDDYVVTDPFVLNYDWSNFDPADFMKPLGDATFTVDGTKSATGEFLSQASSQLFLLYRKKYWFL